MRTNMEICRICMKEEDEHFISIFSQLNDSTIADTISRSCYVQLAEDDGLPDQICASCVQDVQLVVAFVCRVQESDTKWRHLKNDTPEEESKFEVVVVKTESLDESKDSAGEVSQGDFDFGLDSSSESMKLEIMKPRTRKTRRNTLDDDYMPEFGERVVRKKRRSRVAVRSDDYSDEENDNDSFSEKELQIFQTITLPETSFVCCSCYQYFDSLEELEAHVEIHKRHSVKKTDIIHCAVCKRKFNKASALNRHLKNVKALRKLYECIRCKVRFMNSIGRRMHAQRHPKNIEEKIKQEYGEILCCVQNCSKPFSTEELLIQHGHEAHKINKRAYELEDSTLKPVECPVCFKRFPSERLLRRHRKRNSKPLIHQCTTCGLKFRTKDVLANHELNHFNQKPFPCDVCQKNFSSKNSLKVHKRSHSNEKPFVCTTCGAGFFQKAQLTIHEHKHTNAPLPFQCEVCDKSFKMKNYLVNHMRGHTGEKPYPCRHCPMSFSNHTNRQRHEMNHTGIKPFKCSYCDKTFTIKRLQLEHECKHTGIKPYKCSYCEKTFIRRGFQLDHESTHTGIKPYRCEICNRTFSQRAALRRHLESHPAESRTTSDTASSLVASSQLLVGESTMTSPLPLHAPVESTPVLPGPSNMFFQNPENLSVGLHSTIIP
ncbi:zinc finger protein ZFP2-like [Toxorhynchites rutilus septentrionalis]|uniref:zinc finger protein ZFP2-like n=1 Tax=Toxorhynchites rutilus septentrionalis TaxID=329112 RepID=UPI00247A696C|nr:zinc finger protein ZFP2-like [Toxorhynchites rutilus septentrionalis]XP_055644780.1 zinc finger protein ZFP2-like [Toxorhynchites rutilus septentrionalis]XP_055644781.1 zinc finger protein ZFP2-like [Toxorhynchites rutilus septentrionalis]